MANTYKSVYKRFNGIDWDIHHFASVTSQVASDNASRRYVSDDILSWIGTYFDGSSDLLDGFLGNKLPTANPTFTGILTGPTAVLQYGVFNDVAENTGIEFASNTIRMISNGSYKMQILSDRIQFENNRLRSVGSPVDNTDAATKGYVDASVAAGMHPVEYVVAAADSDQSLTNCLAVDGYTLQNGDRVLLKGQTTASQNGIYTSDGSGVLNKVAADSTQGAYVFVANGLSYNDWYFYCQDNNGTWIEQGRPDTVTASGALQRIGNNITVVNSGITNDMLAGSIDWSKLNGSAIYDNSHMDYEEWSDIDSGQTVKSLAGRLCDVLASIGILRGTANFNTNNTQTIAGAYTLANTKNKNDMGTANPSTSGYSEGDVYIQYTA